jgi:TRAP-type C4-dicarboxylate transport system permease small subunit
MRALKLSVDRVLAVFLMVIMGALVVDVLWQVFTRFVMRDPSSYTEELARYLLIWVGLLGAAYVAGQRMHLAVDLLPRHLKGTSRQMLDRVIHGSGFVFGLALVVGGSRLVWVTLILGQSSAALGLPLGAVYTALPLSGLLIMFYSVAFIVYPDAIDHRDSSPDGMV